MRRFAQPRASRAIHALGSNAPGCWALASILACTAPSQFGRTSTVPAPSAISGGPTVAAHAPATGQRVRHTPRPPPPLYPDESRVGAPWSGLQLALAPSLQGIFVGLVARDSPAESSGIQAGDFIFQLSGHPVSDAQEILSEVERVGIGGSLRLGVHRGTHVRLFRVEPIAKPAAVIADEVSVPTLTPQPSASMEPSRGND